MKLDMKISGATSELNRKRKRETILLVDDDAKLLRALKRHLDEDYRVLTAISPGEASVFVAREAVDLILSDNLMSGQLGTKFLESICRQHPNIKLLMLSGYLPENVAKRVIAQCGVHQVLNKPCGITDVESAIRNALSQPPEADCDAMLSNQDSVTASESVQTA